MKAGPWQAALGLAWAAWAGWALWTIPSVPFHPDEATHIYLSADFDRLVYGLDPAGVTWLASDASAYIQRFRLIEAPMSRYLIGLGRMVGGYGSQSLQLDWDWTASWATNAQAGALPGPGLLASSRMPAAILTVLTPLLLFAAGRRLTNPAGGLAAAALFAVSGLALLHGRRAMSEAPLLFCLVGVFGLSLWAIGRRRRAVAHPEGHPPQPIGATAVRRYFWPAILGAAAALPIAAKLSGWAVLPAAVIAAWAAPPLRQPRTRPHEPAARLAVFMLAGILIGWLLTPALWAQPVLGLRVMIAARQQTLKSQTEALAAAGPQILLDGPAEHLLAELYHTYLAPLAYWDIPNYADETAPAERAYAANWLNTGLRSVAAGPRLAVGGVFLALSLAGVVFAGLRWLRAGPSAADREARWPVLLLAVWTAATVVGLFAFDIAWQRYYLPLLPLACLWAGYGVGVLAELWQTRAVRRS